MTDQSENTLRTVVEKTANGLCQNLGSRRRRKTVNEHYFTSENSTKSVEREREKRKGKDVFFYIIN